jgi:hypothetical protein
MDPLRRFFRLFDDGVIFKWLVVCLFALAAILGVVLNATKAYQLARLLGDLQFLPGLGALVLAAALLLGTFLAVLVLGYRGAYAVATRQAAKHSLLSLWAAVLRVVGEAALFYLIVVAPAGCVAIWLSSAELLSYVPFPPAYVAEGAFLIGVFVLLGGIIYGLLIAFVAYILAEICELLPALGADVAAIRAAKAV